MKYSVVLFDLDGTIANTSEGITKSVAFALEKKGFSHEGTESLKCFIGPPLREQFMKYCNVSIEEGEALVKTYREYYSVKGIFECVLYEGVIEMLDILKQKGANVLLATSKPEKFAKMVINHFGIEKYFDFIGGANMDNTRTNKGQVIEYCLRSMELLGNKDTSIMIGDCVQDIIGANECGIDAIGVSYGFGNISDLKALSPKAICDTPLEIAKYLCR